MNYSEALHLVKYGKLAAREGWNGKGMFIFLVEGSEFIVNRKPLLGIFAEGTKIRYHAHIDIMTAQGYVVPWVASHSDQLADDWYILAELPIPPQVTTG